MNSEHDYLDHNATTPLDEHVLEAMMPYLHGRFGNPSSVHRYGRQTRRALDLAREQVAAAVGVQAAQVVFTSGGTEANNLAIKGLTEHTAPGHIVIGATEHASITESAESLRHSGWALDYLSADDTGRLCLEMLPDLLTKDTRLVSVMMANNETGVITDVAALRDMLPERVAVHTDAVQAFGKIPVDFQATKTEMMSLSAHKINGPAGAGALIIDKRLSLRPLLHGGGHEYGLRAGTENIAAIVGFGKAAEMQSQQVDGQQQATLMALRQQLEQQLISVVPGLVIFGGEQQRLANTVFFAVPMIDGEALVMALDEDGFSVASGSACSSRDHEPSHVLTAMGVDENLARCAIRVSLGKGNDKHVIKRFVDSLIFQVEKLNNMAVLAW